MDRRRFGWFALIWLVALAGFIALFPYLLIGIVKATSCHRVGGACGAMAVVVGTTVKPLGVLAAGAVLIWIIWRRVRRLNMRRLWVVAAVLWFLSSVGVLVAARNFWGANFSMGLGFFPPPILPLFLLIFVGFLAVHADEVAPPQTGAIRIAWLIAAVAAGHALIPAAATLVTYPVLLFMDRELAMNALGIAGTVAHIAAFGLPFKMRPWVDGADLAIFTAALTFILINQWRSREPVAA